MSGISPERHVSDIIAHYEEMDKKEPPKSVTTETLKPSPDSSLSEGGVKPQRTVSKQLPSQLTETKEKTNPKALFRIGSNRSQVKLRVVHDYLDSKNHPQYRTNAGKSDNAS